MHDFLNYNIITHKLFLDSYIYIYIFIYTVREKEKERKRKRERVGF
jgi:hypothetical protein